MAQYDAMPHALENILRVRERAERLTDQELITALMRPVGQAEETTLMVKNLLAAEAVSRGLDADDEIIDFPQVLLACGDADHDVVKYLPEEMRERVLGGLVDGHKLPLEIAIANHGFELRLQPEASDESVAKRVMSKVHSLFGDERVEEIVEKAETYSPPKGARAAAKRALAWIENGDAGQGFTMTGRARANQLANGESMSLETVKRMHSFFSRHEVDKKATGFSMGEKGYPSPGRVAWDAWGGDAAARWAAGIASSVEKADGYATEGTLLNARQAAMYDSYEKIAATCGKWDATSGPDGAHYMERSPFVDTGMVCGNCVFYDAPGGCELLNQTVNAVGLCKLWIIPDALIGADSIEKFNPHHDKGGRFASRGGLTHPFAGEGAAGAVARLESGHTADIDADQVGKAFDIMGRGDTHPDVTELHVNGTTIFGGEGLGYRRADMPQIPIEKRATFVDVCAKKGITSVEESVDPQHLKPVQAEISGRTSGRIYRDMKTNGITERDRIIVSGDGYVIDGHHTWAAATALSFGRSGTTLPVYRLNTNHETALAEAHAFADEIGSARQSFEGGDILKFNPYHDRNGRFASRSVGSGMGLGTTGRAAGTSKHPGIHFDKPYAGATGGHLAGIPTKISAEDSPVGEALDPSHSLWHHLEKNPHYDGSPGSPKYRVTAERAAFHEKLVHDSSHSAKPVKAGQDKVFIMLGGGPAAGKSSGLKSGVFTDVPKDHVKINPDDVKVQLPEFDKLRFSRSDAEHRAAASFVHEESSMVAKMQLRAATARGTHIVLDGTGDGSIKSLEKKITDARSAGYIVRGRYATLETDTAWSRALKRSQGSEKRYVAEAVVRSTHADVSKTFDEARKRKLFDDYQLIYTGGPKGSKPILIARGTGSAGGRNPDSFETLDDAKWRDFLAKGEE